MLWKRCYILFWVLQCSKSLEKPRQNRLFTPSYSSCRSSGLDGRCLNQLQCLARGGSLSGYCSNGLLSDSCCIFVKRGCGTDLASGEKTIYWTNKDYPLFDSESNSCLLSLRTSPGICWVKIDFLSFLLPSSKNGRCDYNYLTVLNGASGPGSFICGLKTDISMLVGVNGGQDLRLSILTQSKEYAWNLRLRQIECDKVEPLPRDPTCGFTGAPSSLQARLLSDPKSPKDDSRLHGSRRLRLSHASPALRQQLNEEMSYPGRRFHSPQNLISQKIINGVEAPVFAFPWIVSLQYDGDHFCGGSLIDPSWVMTAGHCFDLPDLYGFLENVDVSIGDHDIKSANETQSTTRRIAHVWIHPSWYRNPGSPGDIALVKLDSPVTSISNSKVVHSVCIPDEASTKKLEENNLSITAGWGVTESGMKSSVLKMVDLKRIPTQLCRKNMKEILIDIEDDMICTFKGRTSKETICSGDSGSPLMVSHGSRFFAIGIVSFSSKDCDAPFPSVYSRVSAYLKWMGAVISSESL